MVSAGGAVSLVFPPGALSQLTPITIQPADAYPASARLVPGTVYELGPPGTRFTTAVGLSIKYDPASLPAGVSERELTLSEAVDGDWQELTAAAVITGDRLVAGSIDGFSTYGILAVPVAGVSVLPDSTGVLVGRQVALSATPQDKAGHPLWERVVTWASSDSAVASVDSSGRVTGASPGAAAIAATSGGQTGRAIVQVSPRSVAVVEVTPAETGVLVGEAVHLQATPRDSGGEPLAGRLVVWASENSSVATVNESGTVTGASPGTAAITATSEGQTGSAVVNVSPVPVAAVEVTPAEATVAVTAAVQLTATLRDGAGNPLAGRVITWASSNPAVAVVDQAGRVVGMAPGTVTIAASREGRSGTAAITVSAVPVGAVEVAPAQANVLVGEVVHLSATPRDAGGNPLLARALVWASADSGVATVDESGTVMGINPGTAAITATSEGQTGTAVVTVSRVPVAAVEVTPADASTAVGAAVQLAATVRDGAGNPLADRVITWASSNSAVAVVDQAGRVVGMSPGAVTVAASSEGRSGTAAITVSTVPVGAMDVTPAVASVWVGAAVQLTATARDAEGNPLAGRVAVWAGANAAVAVVDGSGRVTGVSPGTAAITATSEGQTGTAAVTVTLVPVASVELTPAEASVAVGAAVQLMAALRDGAGNPLVDRAIVWASSNSAVAVVDQGGRVLGMAPGTVTIAASSEGQSGTALITVSAVPVAAVEVTPAAASVLVGTAVPLAATVRDAAGNPLAGRVVVWASGDSTVATVDEGGTVMGVSSGTTTITAASEGHSGTSTVTVGPVPVATVEVAPTEASVAVGASVLLAATPRDGAGNPLAGRVIAWASSNPAVAVVDPGGRVVGMATGTATIAASSDGTSGTALITVSAVPVAAVEVTPPAAVVSVGAAVQLTGTVRDAAGNPLAGRVPTWASANPAVATVDDSGKVMGVNPGTVAITAVREGQTGTATVTVLEPVVTVTMSPGSVSVLPGVAVQFQATPRDAAGNALGGRAIAWASSSPAVASVDETGLMTSVAPGAATVSAVSEGTSGTAPVTVLQPVNTVEVSPVAADILVGQVFPLAATLRGADGTLLTGRTVTWASSDLDVATVDGSGNVEGVSPGPATITATSEGRSGAAAITVQPVPVASVDVAPQSGSIARGSALQLTAQPLDSTGGPLANRAITWSSNAPQIAEVTSAGLVTGVAVGTAIITATSEGRSGTAPMWVYCPGDECEADPTLLPVAAGQIADYVGYPGAALAAGDSYVDPVTGVTVYKVTDGSTPIALNERGLPDYSEGGPHISLPWGPDGASYTLYLQSRYAGGPSAHYFVDFHLTTGTFSDWREAPAGNRELYWAWSNNPATPRIGYYIGGPSARHISRYDTETMAAANTGSFPKSFDAFVTADLEWLHQDANDEWFVAQSRDLAKVVAWNSVTDVVYDVAVPGLDEPHLERGGDFVAIVRNEGSSVNNILLLDLSDGTTSDPDIPVSHVGSVVGYFVATNPDAAGPPEFYYQPSSGTVVQTLVGDQLTKGSAHRAGQWVINNDAGVSQWYLYGAWATGGGSPAVLDAIAFVRLDGSQVRLLAHHYSDVAGEYYDQPHATISPDGKLVLWGSNMNGSGRVDAFLAVVPSQ